MFMVVDSVKGMTVKKSFKYGEYEAEHLFFFFWQEVKVLRNAVWIYADGLKQLFKKGLGWPLYTRI